jgi:3-oxoacyl-[acyl-carrier protein] reductase
MISTGGGSIVNISGGGAAGPRENFTAYAAAKAALVRATEILALEYAHSGISINAVAPGAMPTDMLSGVIAAGPETAGDKEFQSARRVFQNGDAADVKIRAAECVYALCGQDSPRVTGRLISAVWDQWMDLDGLADAVSDSDIYTLRRITPEDRRR